MRSLSAAKTIVFLTAALVIAALAVRGPRGYDQYSVARDATNCRACHGDFRAAPYTAKVDGAIWTDGLHDTHRLTMLGGDCSVCHLTARFPAYLGRSGGGSGAYFTEPYSCAGCHGRAADGTGSTTVPTQGYGAGLRQRHYRAGQTVCVSCHTDANPASKTVVGETVLPPYYNNGDASHPAQPSAPCNPGPAFNESVAGTLLGLDNDGNGAFDLADVACQPSASPGEVSRAAAMTVTAYDKLSGALTIAYAPACGATGNTVEYGSLSGLASYVYGGQVCAAGNTGTATFTVPANSFFLVVANDATWEGSYGKRRTAGTAGERPEDATSAACPLPQALANRCDGP